MIKTILYVLKKILSLLTGVVAALLSALSALLCLSIRWMFDTWNNLTMEELTFHLKAPLEGTNEGMIREYLNVCASPALLVLLVMTILLLSLRGKKRYFAVAGVGVALSLAASGYSLYNAWEGLDVGGYAKSQGTYSTFIEDYYVDPAEVQITFPEQKRNLIYIFLESMEITYADQESGGAFEENVIPELTDLAIENEDFSGSENTLNGGYSMPGSTWTIGAMFAQTSGLPLNISINGNYMDTQDSFFAGVMTLGDILEQEGYSQTLMIGSDAVFGGRQLYFTSHGDYDILDYGYAVNAGWIPEDYRVWWGYEDEKLFKFAKKKLTELSKQDEPFNFTLLTVDTHFEDGYPCRLCPDTYDEQYANVMACSSRQVYDFIKWVSRQSFYENTTIVVAGDHPTMDSDFCEDVPEGYERVVYTSYINSATSPETSIRREYTTFDLFPTTLASIGAEIQGNRLGLGANLFSDAQTLSERVGKETQSEEMRKKSRFMEELADLDEDNKELMIREGKAPTAAVEAGSYQYETGLLPVTVSDIANIGGEIRAVNMAVWTQEDQADLQWIEMAPGDDGKYYGNIYVPNFDYRTGEYHVAVYLVDATGEQYEAGGAVGVVD